jgi:hypothetical protein
VRTAAGAQSKSAPVAARHRRPQRSHDHAIGTYERVLTDAGAVIMRLVPPERAVKKGDSPDAVGQGRRLAVEWTTQL